MLVCPNLFKIVTFTNNYGNMVKLMSLILNHIYHHYLKIYIYFQLFIFFLPNIIEKNSYILKMTLHG